MNKNYVTALGKMMVKLPPSHLAREEYEQLIFDQECLEKLETALIKLNLDPYELIGEINENT